MMLKLPDHFYDFSTQGSLNELISGASEPSKLKMQKLMEVERCAVKRLECLKKITDLQRQRAHADSVRMREISSTIEEIEKGLMFPLCAEIQEAIEVLENMGYSKYPQLWTFVFSRDAEYRI
jgi:hypothetical protein